MGIAFQGLNLPKVLYSADSKYNGKVDVVQVGSTKKIIVDKIEQSISCDSPNAKRLVWGKALDVLAQNEPDLKNILILGLGGGTIQHFIRKQYPDCEIVSVELDPLMAKIAEDYFDLKSIDNHRVIVEDACRVVVDPESYDLEKKSFHAIYVDIYIGSKFPELGTSGNFVSALKQLVVPGGLIIFNRIYTEHHQDDVNIFIDFIKGLLHDVQTYVVAGYTNSDNILIYGRT